MSSVAGGKRVYKKSYVNGQHIVCLISLLYVFGLPVLLQGKIAAIIILKLEIVPFFDYIIFTLKLAKPRNECLLLQPKLLVEKSLSVIQVFSEHVIFHL